jgi:hypothetical protein
LSGAKSFDHEIDHVLRIKWLPKDDAFRVPLAHHRPEFSRFVSGEENDRRFDALSPQVFHELEAIHVVAKKQIYAETGGCALDAIKVVPGGRKHPNLDPVNAKQAGERAPN